MQPRHGKVSRTRTKDRNPKGTRWTDGTTCVYIHSSNANVPGVVPGTRQTQSPSAWISIPPGATRPQAKGKAVATRGLAGTFVSDSRMCVESQQTAETDATDAGAPPRGSAGRAAPGQLGSVPGLRCSPPGRGRGAAPVLPGPSSRCSLSCARWDGHGAAPLTPWTQRNTRTPHFGVCLKDAVKGVRRGTCRCDC